MAKRVRIFDDSAVLLCAAVCLVGLGGFLGWASFAPLDEGVVASGQLVVRGDVKEIAHLEGGIVETIHVREGDAVRAGQPLLTLSKAQTEAVRLETAQNLLVAEANLARLEALRMSADEMRPVESRHGLPEVTMRAVTEQQQRLFEQQRLAFAAEAQVLRTRRTSAEARARDLSVEISALSENLAVAEESWQRREEALAEQLDTVDNVQRAEREVLSLRADLAGLRSERNQALRSAEEAADELVDLESQARRQMEEEAATAAAEILTLQERLSANDDQLSRTLIASPLDGVVLGLNANTVGGVVRPGEALMEIVPQDERVIALLQVPPTDREVVHAGQRVTAQLSAYKRYRVPRIEGEVLSISADLRTSEETGFSYYEARVVLDPATLSGLPDVELLPGLPVEAFIASGQSRTLLDYMLEPITSTLGPGLGWN